MTTTCFSKLPIKKIVLVCLTNESEMLCLPYAVTFDAESQVKTFHDKHQSYSFSKVIKNLQNTLA